MADGPRAPRRNGEKDEEWPLAFHVVKPRVPLLKRVCTVLELSHAELALITTIEALSWR